jgi:hypothetical protein
MTFNKTARKYDTQHKDFMLILSVIMLTVFMLSDANKSILLNAECRYAECRGTLLGPYSKHFVFFVTYEWAPYLSLTSLSSQVYFDILACWAHKQNEVL